MSLSENRATKYITGCFSNANEIMTELLQQYPFCFNQSNSDIYVQPCGNCEIAISIEFGNGKGWNTLDEAAKKASRISHEWGEYVDVFYMEEYLDYQWDY